MIRKLLPVLLVLALSTIACGFHVSVPIHTVTPGPMVTDPINVTITCQLCQHGEPVACFRRRHAKNPPRFQQCIGLRHCHATISPISSLS